MPYLRSRLNVLLALSSVLVSSQVQAASDLTTSAEAVTSLVRETCRKHYTSCAQNVKGTAASPYTHSGGRKLQTVGEKCKKEKVQACVEAMQIEALGAGHSVAKACTAITHFVGCLRGTGCEDIQQIKTIVAAAKRFMEEDLHCSTSKKDNSTAPANSFKPTHFAKEFAAKVRHTLLSSKNFQIVVKKLERGLQTGSAPSTSPTAPPTRQAPLPPIAPKHRPKTIMSGIDFKKIYKIGITPRPPYAFVMNSKLNASLLEVQGGFVVEAWEHFAEKYGITYQWVNISGISPSDALNGANPLVDVIADGRPRSINSPTNVYFTQAFWFTGIDCLYRKPVLPAFPLRVIVDLDWKVLHVLFSVLCVLAGAGLMYHLTEFYWNRKEDREASKKGDEENEEMKSVTDDSESSDTESNYSEDGEIGCCAKICDALAHCACCGFMRDDNAAANIANGIYWATITLTTVGLGDIAPKTKCGRLFGILWILMSTCVSTWIFARAASAAHSVGLAHKLTSINGLANFDVGVVNNSMGHSYALQHGVNTYANVVTFHDSFTMLRALRKNKIHACFGLTDILEYESKKPKFKDTYATLKINAHKSGIALEMNNHTFSRFVSQAIVSPDIMDPVVEKYFGNM